MRYLRRLVSAALEVLVPCALFGLLLVAVDRFTS